MGAPLGSIRFDEPSSCNGITTIDDYENGMALFVLASFERRSARHQFVGNNSLYYLALLIEC